MHHDLGSLLSSARISQDITMAAMAEVAGVSVPTIRNLERGIGNVGSYQRCLDGLRLNLHWLDTARLGQCESLIKRRKSLGLSQRALAKKVGISHRTVIALENKFTGRIDTLQQCLSVLRLRPTLRSVANDTTGIDARILRDDRLLGVLGAGDGDTPRFALLHGDAHKTMQSLPSAIVDCIITSPPYWDQRTYAAGGIGEERSVDDYLSRLRAVFRQAHRLLKPRGSMWLNIDDTYHQGTMLGIPWRLTLGLVEDCGWLIRNDNIWAKTGGSLNRADNRLTHRHEHIFHLVKQSDYWFDADSIRLTPKPARLGGDVVATATGVTLKACIDRIADANDLTEAEQSSASAAVQDVFHDISEGRLHDFRLIIRGQNRVTHSDDQRTSARAERLERDGFYLLKYNPEGSLPNDVWNIAPERSTGRGPHYAPFPEALCEIPLKATCPTGGIVLDPFAGSGTTLKVAKRLGRHGIGIDLSVEYLQEASERLSLVPSVHSSPL